MTTELTALAWTLVLAVVQLMLPAGFRTRETGIDYNAGPRDGPGPPVGVVTARLQRAQANLYETLPLFAAAVLIAHVAGREGVVTAWAAWIYLAARVVYLPLYGYGVPKVRSVAWGVSLVAVLALIAVVLLPR